jgi:hypothetical protein
MTDHARRDSVMKYTEVKAEAKRRIVADIIKMRRHQVSRQTLVKSLKIGGVHGKPIIL